MYILNGSRASYLRSMYFYIFGIKYEYVPPAVSKNKFNHIDTDQKTKKIIIPQGYQLSQNRFIWSFGHCYLHISNLCHVQFTRT